MSPLSSPERTRRVRVARQSHECVVAGCTIWPGQRYSEASTNVTARQPGNYHFRYLRACAECVPLPPAPPRKPALPKYVPSRRGSSNAAHGSRRATPDESAVHLLMGGEPITTTVNTVDVWEAIDRLDRRGMSARDIAERVGCSNRTVVRRRVARADRSAR